MLYLQSEPDEPVIFVKMDDLKTFYFPLQKKFKNIHHLRGNTVCAPGPFTYWVFLAGPSAGSLDKWHLICAAGVTGALPPVLVCAHVCWCVLPEAGTGGLVRNSEESHGGCGSRITQKLGERFIPDLTHLQSEAQRSYQTTWQVGVSCGPFSNTLVWLS